MRFLIAVLVLAAVVVAHPQPQPDPIIGQLLNTVTSLLGGGGGGSTPNPTVNPVGLVTCLLQNLGVQNVLTIISSLTGGATASLQGQASLQGGAGGQGVSFNGNMGGQASLTG